MAIGERIRFIRNLRGMTQKWLGQAVGFPPKTADVRMADVYKRQLHDVSYITFERQANLMQAFHRDKFVFSHLGKHIEADTGRCV